MSADVPPGGGEKAGTAHHHHHHHHHPHAEAHPRHFHPHACAEWMIMTEGRMRGDPHRMMLALTWLQVSRGGAPGARRALTTTQTAALFAVVMALATPWWRIDIYVRARRDPRMMTR